MLSLNAHKISFSTMVFGIVHGKVVGIAHSIMIEDGVSIGVFHLGMEEYILVGEIIIDSIRGEDIHGAIA
jgi:hypothetical protein